MLLWNQMYVYKIYHFAFTVSRMPAILVGAFWVALSILLPLEITAEDGELYFLRQGLRHTTDFSQGNSRLVCVRRHALKELSFYVSFHCSLMYQLFYFICANNACATYDWMNEKLHHCELCAI